MTPYGTEVAISVVNFLNMRVSMVVVFRREKDVYHVVTVYSVRQPREEIERKVKSGRWIKVR